MLFTTLFALVCLFLPFSTAAPAPRSTVTVTLSYDQTYDNANGDLHTVACSDGPNGMLTKGEPPLTRVQ